MILPPMGREKVVGLVLLGAVTALALAANHYFFQWVLLSDDLMRGILH